MVLKDVYKSFDISALRGGVDIPSPESDCLYVKDPP